MGRLPDVGGYIILDLSAYGMVLSRLYPCHRCGLEYFSRGYSDLPLIVS